MVTKCKKSEILRKSYIKKNGTKVDAKCIKDKGLPGKGPIVMGKLTKGTLTQFGYSSKKPVAQRHAALKKAVTKLGKTDIIKKLNAVSILTKNTRPETSKIFSDDLAWVQAN